MISFLAFELKLGICRIFVHLFTLYLIFVVLLQGGTEIRAGTFYLITSIKKNQIVFV